MKPFFGYGFFRTGTVKSRQTRQHASERCQSSDGNDRRRSSRTASAHP